MRVLVTGCRGFIGGGIGRFAASAGHELLGVARSSQPELGWVGGYAQADVLHTDLSELIRDFAPDVVFHGAGTASVGASVAAPLDDMRAAVLTWANTLESVRRSGTSPLVIFPSSAAVYGNPTTLPVSEDALIAPISPYGFHKAACELIAREYAECYGLNVVLCRIFSVLGPQQRRLLIWELFRQVMGPGDTVWLQGTGRETRDYLHIDDFSGVVLQIAAHLREHQAPSAAGCRVFNVASGHETSVLSVAEKIRDILSPAKDVQCRGLQRPGDPVRWFAEVARLQAFVGDWKPRPLQAALEDCLAAWS